MRTLSIVLILMACSTTTWSQSADTTMLLSKRGRPILPQEGDFSIGLDATPFLQYFGNMFNNTTNNAPPVLRSPYSPSIIAKYMRNAKTAIRVRVALNNASTEGKNQVDNTASSDPSVFVTDTKTYASTNILFGAGLEKRRGNGRLQGIYGVEAFVGFASSSSTYTYGNTLTLANPLVSTTQWTANGVGVTGVINTNTRPLESSSGSSISFGVTGFVGFEYFVAPKMSLGGELGYSISSVGSGTGTQKTETWNFGTNSLVVTTTDYFPNPSSFSFGTVPSGNIFINVYF